MKQILRLFGLGHSSNPSYNHRVGGRDEGPIGTEFVCLKERVHFQVLTVRSRLHHRKEVLQESLDPRKIGLRGSILEVSNVVPGSSDESRSVT